MQILRCFLILLSLKILPTTGLAALALPISSALIDNPFQNNENLNVVLDNLSEADGEQKGLTDLLERGWLSFSTKAYEDAEREWIKALQHPLTKDIEKALLRQMCELYAIIEKPAKEILMYEKYIERFEDDELTPYLILKVGKLYRKAGVPELAISRYYTILNRALTIPQDQLENYKRLIILAQIEIASAYLDMGDFAKTLELLDKIQTNLLSPEEYREVIFQKALCAYETKDYSTAIRGFETFCERYSNQKQTPKAYFLRIQSYRALGQNEKILSSVLALLQEGQKRRLEKTLYWEKWDYWQKKAAEDVAQDFYTHNKFLDALKIYQAMVQVEAGADWQWPILYAMGACYERLQMFSRSRAAYELIATAKDSWNGIPLKLNELLKDYREEALWRLKQLERLETNKTSVNQLLDSLPQNAQRAHKIQVNETQS